MGSEPLQPFQAFLDEHRTPVLAYLRGMVGHGEAEDCFQETFMAALKSYETLSGANPRAWIMTIARNKAIDHHRARRRRPEPRGSDLPAPAAPAQAFERRDEDLWSRVALLPDRQRQAVGLRFCADLRYREIGEAMDSSEEAARRNVHEGLKRLRRELGQEAA